MWRLTTTLGDVSAFRAVPRLPVNEVSPCSTHSYAFSLRGMPLWAGAWLGWLSRLGIPIHRGKHLDWTGLRTARDLLANGKLPVAPEGAPTVIVKLSVPGTGCSAVGVWCVEDLVKGRSEAVYIVPIGIQYRIYVKPPWRQLDWLLSQLEADSGFVQNRAVCHT